MSNKSQEEIRQSSNRLSHGDSLLQEVEDELGRLELRRKELRQTLVNLKALKKSGMPSGVWQGERLVNG